MNRTRNTPRSRPRKLKRVATWRERPMRADPRAAIGAGEPIADLPAATTMLASLLHRRWSVPVIAALHDWKGSKFITLVNRLGASRDSMQQTLGELKSQRLVARHPGVGHPMRPEYILTRRGETVGPSTSELMLHLRANELIDIALRKWSLPTVLTLSGGPRRFSELRAAMPDISPRALALALKDLADARLVERQIVDGYPPSTRYQLTGDGRAIAPLLGPIVAGLGR